MPQMQVKTTSAEKIWSSPDGQRTIFKVNLEMDGNQFSAKTYSKQIAEVGFEGEVESYEKQGQRGAETFVKQPPKENGWSGGGRQSSSTVAQSATKPTGFQPKGDNYTMYLSYVKDIAVALIGADKYSLEQLAQIVEEVGAEGKHLYSLREGAPDEQEDIKKELDKAFGDTEEPWTPKDEELPQFPSK